MSFAISRLCKSTGRVFAIAKMFIFAWMTVAHPTNLAAIGPDVVFSSNRDGNWEIYRMDRDGSHQVNLTANSAFDADPAYLPSGEIVFSSDRNSIGNKLYIMNGDGSNVRLISVGVSTAPDGSVFYGPEVLSTPACSLDGSKIACVLSLVPGGPPSKNQIWVLNSDGSNFHNVSNNSFNDSDPTFTPDGQKIVFCSDQYGNSDIFIMNVDGSNRVRLTTNTSDDSTPDVSPDGSRIAFTAERDGNFEVYTMRIDGSQQTNLSNNSDADGDPVFSPDGSQIIFVSGRDGNYELFGMPSNGGAPTQLTFTTPPALQLQPCFRNFTRLTFAGFHQCDPPPAVPSTFGPLLHATCNYGCALVSVANMLASYGISITPSRLNDLLLVPSDYGTPIGYSPDNDLLFPAVPQAVQALAKIRFIEGGKLKSSLDDYLNEHFLGREERVILKLNAYKNGSLAGSHFVLVTGKDGNGWSVFDPGWTTATPQANLTSLQGHLSGFTTGSGFHSFTVAEVRTFAKGDNSANLLVRAYSPVNLLVTDPLGRRIGFDYQAAHDTVEIPGASFLRESPLADLNGNGPSVGDATGIQTLYVPTPLPGSYKVETVGTAAGSYALDVENIGASGSGSRTRTAGVTAVGLKTTNNVASPSVTTCDLALSATVSPMTAQVGSNLTYTLVVTNNGPTNATAVKVLTSLPTNVVFNLATCNPGVISNLQNGISWNIGNLGMGQNATASITGTVVSTNTTTGSSSVILFEDDLDPGNNIVDLSASMTNFSPQPSHRKLAFQHMKTSFLLVFFNGQLRRKPKPTINF